MKNLGFYFYDIVVIFKIYIGNGLSLPLSSVNFSVSYRDKNSNFLKEIKNFPDSSKSYLPGGNITVSSDKGYFFVEEFLNDIKFDQNLDFDVFFGYSHVIRFLTNSNKNRWIVSINNGDT